GDFQAVKGISFTVKEGEIFSFLGPNGAGKSTTINVLTTLLPVQKGEVRIAGYDVSREPENVRKTIGIVFQEVTLDRDMTVREILEFHGRIYGMPREERGRRIENLLQLVDLTSKRDTLTKYLSGGMKRRLEIARGLMTRPRLLFLDEPTLGLDPQTRMKIWDYIEEVNQSGTTIFLTTHYMDEADNLSDRISLIDHGEIIVTGTPYDLKNSLGEDLVYLETNDNQKVRDLAKSMPSVKSTTPKGNGLTLLLNTDGTKVLPRIMETVQESGVNISLVNLKKPSMDDVFLHYTGRAIREGGTGTRG
ncbi:MAG TPA: ATP-binding cassette domain-containing protein, partial [Methanomicrobiales archaeon]|nr:ATP-binding cassette domain-containing protein [Methanomicrobiales archaeon]